jgi:exodeoxyribonuclease VII large subunit
MNIVSVSEITKYIKQLFEYDAKIAAVFVRGEISNFKRHFSGHCYFTLKDSNATIKVVMFKSRAQFLKFAPSDGMKVIVGGQITVFERDGQYQLYAQQLVPEGIGELSFACIAQSCRNYYFGDGCGIAGYYHSVQASSSSGGVEAISSVGARC